MLNTIGNAIGSRLSSGWDLIYWVMMEMDVIQWGVMSMVFVVSGFVALRTRF